MSNTNIKNRVITDKLPWYMLARFTIHRYTRKWYVYTPKNSRFRLSSVRLEPLGRLKGIGIPLEPYIPVKRLESGFMKLIYKLNDTKR